MKMRELAMATVCAVAFASWASPVSVAQQRSASADQGPGQQGEFNGDHQDTGAAAIDGKEAPEPGEAPEAGKEVPETAEPNTANAPQTSPRLSATARAEEVGEMHHLNSTDTDRLQDAASDLTPQ
jgi:hypothetical protein